MIDQGETGDVDDGGGGGGSELVQVIVKTGDDLRQDALTLQSLAEMERAWNADGLHDILLTPYRVVSTGYNSGMIEAVVGRGSCQLPQVPTCSAELE